MLSDLDLGGLRMVVIFTSLNAPYGARCFLTSHDPLRIHDQGPRLNAPYGARCFLTGERAPG